MPIFVDEVVISVEVEGRPAVGGRPSGPTTSTEDKQAMIAECVERILEILAQRQER